MEMDLRNKGLHPLWATVAEINDLIGRVRLSDIASPLYRHPCESRDTAFFNQREASVFIHESLIQNRRSVLIGQVCFRSDLFADFK